MYKKKKTNTKQFVVYLNYLICYLSYIIQVVVRTAKDMDRLSSLSLPWEWAIIPKRYIIYYNINMIIGC